MAALHSAYYSSNVPLSPPPPSYPGAELTKKGAERAHRKFWRGTRHCIRAPLRRIDRSEVAAREV
eukprot:11290993-Alexandrium_andersonii.AAC.1